MERQAALEEHRTPIPPEITPSDFDVSLVTPPKKEKKEETTAEVKKEAKEEKKSEVKAEAKAATDSAAAEAEPAEESETALGDVASDIITSLYSVDDTGGIEATETVTTPGSSGNGSFAAAAEANETTEYFAPAAGTTESSNAKSQIPGGTAEVTSVDSSGAQTVTITVTFP